MLFRLNCLPQSQEPAAQNWFVVVEAQDWVAAQLEVGLFVQGSQRFPLCKKLLATLRPPPNALHTQTTECTNLFSLLQQILAQRVQGVQKMTQPLNPSPSKG